ncbi:YitT family protein [Rhizobium sp. PAMB 3182]
MAQIKRVLDIFNTEPSKHSVAEDAQGIFFGCMMAALGLYFLNKVGILIGGTAGVAFLIHYATGMNFGLLFFLVNLPFYYLSFRRIGLAFSVKTFIAIAVTSGLTEIESRFLDINYLDPIWGAVLGGLLVGFGLLALYRHRASLGGIGILAVYLQDHFGWRAGLVQMAFDAIILVLSFLVLTPFIVFCSVVSAVVLNFFVAINHRSDRYVVLR